MNQKPRTVINCLASQGEFYECDKDGCEGCKYAEHENPRGTGTEHGSGAKRSGKPIPAGVQAEMDANGATHHKGSVPYSYSSRLPSEILEPLSEIVKKFMVCCPKCHFVFSIPELPCTYYEECRCGISNKELIIWKS